MVPRHDTPAGRPTPKGAAIMPTDKRVSEGFHLIPHHACRTHVTKVASRTMSHPQHRHQMRPDTAESTTTALPMRTSQPLGTATMTTRHQQRQREESSATMAVWPTKAGGRGQTSTAATCALRSPPPPLPVVRSLQSPPPTLDRDRRCSKPHPTAMPLASAPST